MRESCLLCVMKHLGEAAIFEAEFRLGYPQFEVYVVGSLSHAAQEALKYNEKLAEVIREHRINWMEDPLGYDIPYEALGVYVRTCIDTGEDRPAPSMPSECFTVVQESDLDDFDDLEGIEISVDKT